MRIFLGALLSLSLVTPALANPAAGGFQQTPPPPAAGGFQQPGGGFTGPGTPVGVTTVGQALKARDDAPCVLEGSIVQKVPGEDEEYVFRDATGQIRVEIDDSLFAGVNVTPQNRVRITGKVDGDVGRRNEIDAASLQVIR